MATWARVSGQGLKDVVATQTNSEGAPTSSDGLSLDGVAGFTFWAQCATGQTFNNAASVFAAWRYDPACGDDPVRAPELDVTVGASGVGLAAFASAFTVGSPRGRIVHVWDGTGVTGGDVTTTYTASLLTGERGYP